MIQIGGGGGAATPAGSDTQVQFNDGGTTFGADAGLVFDKATGKLTVGKQLVISSGAVTTSAPLLDLAQTWNSAGTTFTGLKFNVTDTASASGSLLADWQVGGASKFKVNKTGTINASAFYVEATNRAGVAYQVGQDGLELFGGGTSIGCTNNQGIVFAQGKGLGWVAGLLGSSSTDLILLRDAADILAQRRSTTAQTFRVYNTFTDASNYERGKIAWAANVLQVGTEKGGTGIARALELQTDGTTRLTIGSAGGLTIADANNIAVGTTTGTKIGTATTQKLGFYNAAPVVQPAAVADATGAGDVVAQLNLLLSRMRDLGLIAP